MENQEEEEVASENVVVAEGTQESEKQETESSSPETSATFHSKSPCVLDIDHEMS